jgi:hypothetical protein
MKTLLTNFSMCKSLPIHLKHLRKLSFLISCLVYYNNKEKKEKIEGKSKGYIFEILLFILSINNKGFWVFFLVQLRIALSGFFFPRLHLESTIIIKMTPRAGESGPAAAGD